MPRAIIAALLIVTTVYLLVRFAALGAQPAEEFASEEQANAGLVGHPGEHHRKHLGEHGSRRGRGDLHLLGDPGGDVRPDPHPVRDGPRRPASVDVRKVNPRTMTPVNNTIIVAVVVAILAGFIPLDYLLDMVSIGTLVAFIVVSIGVIILRVREPDLPRGFKVPLYPVIRLDNFNLHLPFLPVLSVVACIWVLQGLHWYTWAGFGAWVGAALVYYLVWSATTARSTTAAMVT